MICKRFIISVCAWIALACVAVICGYELGELKHAKQNPVLTKRGQPTNDIIAAVAKKLEAYKNWTVRRTEGKYGEFLRYISETPLPAVFVSYAGSEFNVEKEGRVLFFYVIVVIKKTGNYEEDLARAVKLANRAIALINNEKYKNVRFRFRCDSYFQRPEDNLSGYELTFEALDN